MTTQGYEINNEKLLYLFFYKQKIVIEEIQILLKA